MGRSSSFRFFPSSLTSSCWYVNFPYFFGNFYNHISHFLKNDCDINEFSDGYSRFVSVGGSANTPNAAHSIGGARGPVLAGPSMRLIADMSGTVPNQMVLPMGESGVPSSPHYDDQLAAWAANQLYEVDWAMFSNSK